MKSKRSSIIKSVAEKLNPNRFTHMSPKMSAVVGFLLGEKFTDPEISDMIITSDGFILINHGNEFFGGTRSNLRSNLSSLIKAADLTEEEAAYFHAKFRRIVDWETGSPGVFRL